MEKLVVRNPSQVCIYIQFIQLHTPTHNTFSYLWLEVKLQNADLFSTTSVQAHLQHQWFYPLSLALGFQKSYISLQQHHSFTKQPQKNSLIYKDLFPHLWHISSLLGGLPGCWTCKSCLAFVMVQDAEITVTGTSQGFVGETWLRSQLIWKLPNRVRLGKFWVQNWMAKRFPSCGPLYIL